MKKTNLLTLVILTVVYSLSFMTTMNAQYPQKLIHYWDFNQTLPHTGGGAKTTYAADSLGTKTLPLNPSYSQLTSSYPAVIRYYRPQGVQPGAAIRDSIVDNSTAGSFLFEYLSPTATNTNYQYWNSTRGIYEHYATTSDTVGAGNYFIRTRQPDENAAFILTVPTVHYQNIKLNFALSGSSSKMAQYLIFTYSKDGGNTWNKLNTAMDTFNIHSAGPDSLYTINYADTNSLWTPIHIDFSSDPGVNNNPGFMINIQSVGSNSAGSSGNVRYDNFAILGDTTTSCLTTTITSQPTNLSVCAGNNATFTVGAFGASLTYQWYVNTGSGFTALTDGGVYSGSATKTLTITGATSAMNAYSYHCVLTNVGCDAGATTSNATLSVGPSVDATITPSGATTICQGAVVTLSAPAGMKSYSWSNSATTQSISVSASGTYSVTVTACSGATASSSQLVTVNPAPSAVITAGGATTFCLGDSVLLAVSAGAGNTYTWSTGESTDTIYAKTTASYSVSVTSPIGCVTKSAKTAVVVNTPVAFANLPLNDSVCTTRNAFFYALPTAASGTVSYQWQNNTGSGFNNVINGSNFAGATSNELEVVDITAANVNATYRCIVTSALGCGVPVTSDTVKAVINDALCASTNQTSMIHYWNFDQTNPIGGAGGVDLNNIPADFSAIGGASIKYAYILNANGGRPRDTATTTAIIDNVSPGDNSINYRAGYGNFANYNNSGIRFRNPSDSMNYLLFIPTTGFTNIVVTYATESSSTGSGSHEQLFSYSLDSGVTFTTANLPVAYDSAGLAWSLAQLNLSAITGVNNNPKFVLRIHQSAPNTGSSGNNRYDNITVEGVPFAPTISAVTSNSPVCSKDSVQLNVVASSPSLVTYSWSGIGTFNSTTTANPFVKQFESGTYTVTVSNSGGSTTGTVTVVNSLPSDINYDGQVNVNDFLIFVNAYGQPCSHCPSDINQDGQVNVNDFLVFVNAYNTSCK